MVLKDLKRKNSFSASTVAKAMADKANASQMEAKLAYIKLNSQTPSALAQATARQVPASWRWLSRHSRMATTDAG